MSEAGDSDVTTEKAGWSFELGAFHRHLPEGNDLESMIRGHLYLEHVLIHLLREALPRFDLLQVERIAFNTKVELCAGLGLLSPQLMLVMKRLNELRNRFAHRLDYAISIQDKKDILNMFDPIGRSLILERKIDNPIPVEDLTISDIIKATVVIADMGRQNYIEWKNRRDKAFQNARDALKSIGE